MWDPTGSNRLKAVIRDEVSPSRNRTPSLGHGYAMKSHFSVSCYAV